MNNADSTETTRRQMLAEGEPATALAADPDQTWNGVAELECDFEVFDFLAPFVMVRRRSDGAIGTLEFTNSPRVYFGFQKDEGK